MLNNLFSYVTLDEAIELVLELNDRQLKNHSDIHTSGIYIETKMYDFYKKRMNVSVVKKTFETLQKYNLSTLAEANAKIPVILQSFEKDALLEFR